MDRPELPLLSAPFARDLTHRILGGEDDIDGVLRKLELFTSVGATIGAFEQLAASRTLSDDGLFGWPVMRLRSPGWWRSLGDERLAGIFGYPQVMGLVQARALSGLGLILPGASRAQRGLLSASMCATAHGLHTRMGGYGLDGSDHLTFVNYFVAAAEKAFGDDPKAREALVWFLAAQVCGAYFSAGVAKLASPVWRDGTAIPEIFRTSTFGDSGFYRVVKENPRIAKAVAWATIAGEMAFPLVLVAPRPVARGILASGFAFHLGNARFMGLNRFIWSYCSTYPALAHVARDLGPRTAPAKSGRAPSRSPLSGGALSGKGVAGLARAVTSKRGIALAAAGVGAAALAGSAVRHVAKVRQGRLMKSLPGSLVRVGERRVHVMGEPGDEGPSVVFENGLGAPATQWGWVMRGLPPGTPRLAYDRPGVGWSEPLRRSLDPEAAGRELLGVLREFGLKPPYVLVGHSIGGLLIRCFARRHPELVGGLVFVDSSHPEQFVRSPKQREALPWIRQRLATTQAQAAAGLLKYAGRTDQMDSLPADLAEATHECVSHPRIWGTARRELAESQRSWSADAALLPQSASMPVAVVTAGETVRSDPMHTELQQELARLSQVSRRDVVSDAGHESLVLAETYAPRVVEAVEWVRARVPAAGETGTLAGKRARSGE
jgi:pimeloyl-ACP methyl ester carboxylesterase